MYKFKEDSNISKYQQAQKRNAYSGAVRDMFAVGTTKFIIPYEQEGGLSEKNKKLFQIPVKFWSAKSCLQFKKKETHQCSGNSMAQQRAVLVKTDVSGCTRSFDRQTGCILMPTQTCGEEFIHSVFAQLLGGLQQQWNKASADFVSINRENLNYFSDGQYHEDNGKHLAQVFPSQKCASKRYKQIYTPFDFMSVLMDTSTTEFGIPQEGRPVVVSYGSQRQYLLDYHKIAWLQPSFLDMFTVNSVWHCTIKWNHQCSKNGKVLPKCKNFGYVGHNCKCQCGPGFKGSTCEKKEGGWYPPQNGTVFEFQIASNQDYDFADLKMKPMLGVSRNPDFKYYQFINIQINPKDNSTLPSISLFLPFEKVTGALKPKQDMIIQHISSLDCGLGPKVTWGHSELGKMASECFSTLVNNEKLEDSRVFRGRKSRMTMYMINGLGKKFSDEQVSIHSSEFRLVTKFNTLELRNDTFGDTNGNGTAGSGAGGDGTIGSGGTAGAMTAASGTAGLIGAIVGGLLLLLLCLILLLCFLKRRKKKKEEEILEEGENEEKHTSESEDSDAT